MAYYPLFLDLSARSILIVGAGRVGRRKLESLREASPRSILVVDPALDAAAAAELAGPGTTIACRAFSPEDIDGKHLVFAASGDTELNAKIAALCAERQIFCNSAAPPPPEAGDCIVPASFETDGLCISVSTAGQSPALAKRLRRELEAYVGSRYSPLLRVMGRLRPLLLSLGLPTEANSALFRELIASSLADCLEKKDYPAAGEVLLGILPKQLHSHVGELLHGS